MRKLEGSGAVEGGIIQRFTLTALALALLAGCSSGTVDENAVRAPENAAQNSVVPSPSASPAPMPTGSTKVLGLEGLGDLRIGAPVPEGSSWAERGAQASDACHIVTSPLYPGVNAIVTGGKVRRITLGQRSDVKLAEGIGVGAREADVQKWFAGFRTEPHKYVSAPAKYLTAPNAASGDPALRFEIGADEKVSMIHVGAMPELAYVEGCA